MRNWDADFTILAVAVFLILLFLTCLPLFLVMRYKRVEYDKLEGEASARFVAMWVRTRGEAAKRGVMEFQDKNSWSAYFYPDAYHHPLLVPYVWHDSLVSRRLWDHRLIQWIADVLIIYILTKWG